MLRQPVEGSQSVSSENSDEDYCDEPEQEGEGNSDDYQQRRSVGADNLQLPPPQQLESPAPAVVLGGDNEFVKVSHLGSIEVKEVAQKQLPTSRPRVLPLAANHRRTSTGSEPFDEGEQTPPFKRISASTATSDNSSGSVEDMEKSPYEVDYDAEKGDKIFIEMKEALKEDKHLFGKPTLRAVEMFGNKDANRIVRAKPLIDKSGIVFSQGWTDGNFRGTIVGKIAAEQLIVCLCSNRFIKASEMELSGICRDLKLYTLISEAIEKWDLKDEFKLVQGCVKNYAFTAKKRDCFKCAIFIARLYSCFKNSGRTKLPSRLMNKAKACLTIMETHMPEDTSPNKRKKKPVDHEIKPRAGDPGTLQNDPLAAASEQAAPKRKRGRPPKNPKSALPKASPVSSSTRPVVSETKKRKAETEEAAFAKNAKSVPARDRQGSSSGEENTDIPTIHHLIKDFEQKYEELGSILQQIKAASRRPQERTEAQIRADVLEEVQRSVMKSFPKK